MSLNFRYHRILATFHPLPFHPLPFHPLPFLLLVGLLLMALGCGDNAVSNLQTEIPPYPTIQIEKRTVEEAVTYPASIEGTVNSDVRAKVAGYIQDVLVDEGEWVQEGQELFKLETQSLSLEAEAAKARMRVLQVEVDKLGPLVSQDIISPIQLETARANLAQAESSYQSLMANIGYARIRSPINGIVGTITYRQGSLVSAQDPQPLTTVSSIEEVFAYFSMNEKDFIRLIRENKQEGLNSMTRNLPSVQLLLADGSVYGHEGKIETISGSVDPASGTVRFRATFPNPGGLLRNGSSGIIRLAKKLENVLVVPTLSTFEQQGKTFVYLVTNDSVHARNIEVMAETNGYTVLEGLSEGAQILAKGVGKIRPGSRIDPQPTSIDSIVQSFEQVFK